MKDELLRECRVAMDRLQEYLRRNTLNFQLEKAQSLIDLLDAKLDAALSAPSGWIPVTPETMPDECVDVLCYFGDHCPAEVGTYSGVREVESEHGPAGQIWQSSQGNMEEWDADPTHWMPLPAQPNAAPQPSTVQFVAAPSQKGVGQGEVAVAATTRDPQSIPSTSGKDWRGPYVQPNSSGQLSDATLVAPTGLTREQVENLKRLAKLHGRLHEPDCSKLCDLALSALQPDAATEKDEVAWLLERSGPEYLASAFANCGKWTTNAWKAVRFETKEAAEKLINDVALGASAIEHRFCALPPDAGAVQLTQVEQKVLKKALLAGSPLPDADTVRDAERYQQLRKLAHKSEAYDRYPGYHWSVLFYDDEKEGFDATVDAMLAAARKEG